MLEKESWKSFGLLKLKEQSISDRVFISDWHIGFFYVDKINILYYLMCWTRLVLQGSNSLQIMSYMHTLPLKTHTETKLRTGEPLLSSCL